MMKSINVPVYSAEDIDIILSQIDVVETMRQAFLNLAHGQAAQPDQKVIMFPNQGGDCIGYFGIDTSSKVLGVKMSPYIITNEKPLVTAWTLLLSTENGQPLMLCDSQRLTIERTAATTVLAVDELARKDARVLTVIGTGEIGLAHVRHALDIRQWEHIRIYSRKAGVVRDLIRALPADDRISIVSSLEIATADTDVLMLCTSSATPVIEPDMLKKNCLITSITSNVEQAHEVPPSFLSQMDVYCDYRHTTPQHAAEMCLARQHHGWTDDAIKGDLPELVVRRCKKPDYQRHVFFRSLGLGIEDIAIASQLFSLMNALTP